MSEPTQPLPASQEPGLYTVPLHSVVFRNFLSGFSRSLGVVSVYVVFLLVIGYGFSRVVWPQLAPIMSSLNQATQALEAQQSQLESIKQVLPLTQ